MAERFDVRYQRLILEAGPNAVTVRFHPRLTVIAGVGRSERDGLVGELLGAMAGGRGGAHLEIMDDHGRRLAVTFSTADSRDPPQRKLLHRNVRFSTATRPSSPQLHLERRARADAAGAR